MTRSRLDREIEIRPASRRQLRSIDINSISQQSGCEQLTGGVAFNADLVIHVQLIGTYSDMVIVHTDPLIQNLVANSRKPSSIVSDDD